MILSRMKLSIGLKYHKCIHGFPIIPPTSRMCFSVEASAFVDNHAPFRTIEDNPVNHKINHVAKFYNMTKEIKEKLFPLTGITKKYVDQMEMFNECCLMVRPGAVELISYLERTDFTRPVVRYLLYGDAGVGKTLALCHVIHYAYMKQWIILHAPWAPSWTAFPKEHVVSQYNTERYDTPLDAAVWLQQFRSQNAHLLELYDIRVSKRYEWSVREVTEEGEPLLSVIEHGVARLKHASDCAAVVMKEIKAQSQVKGFKVLVAGDGVNSFFMTSRLKRPDRTFVSPTDITIVRAFRKLLNNDWVNASIVVTIGTTTSPGHHRNAFTPYYLLGLEGFELLNPFIPILVKNYSHKEIDSCLDYYIDRMWIQTEEGKTDSGRDELKFLSGYNPAELMKLCSYR